MTYVVLGVAVFLVLGLGLCTRNTLAYLLWPVLLAYPNRLLYGLLPLNAGFDDVFILCCFLVFCLKGRVRNLGWSGRMIVGFFCLYLLGQVTGVFLGGSGLIVPTLKDTLKMSVGVAFALTVISAAETETDLRRIFISYLIGITLGCITAWGDWLRMPWGRWFWVAASAQEELTQTRAAGAFLSPGSAGVNVGIALIMVGVFLVHRGRKWHRLAALALAVFFAGTVVVSGSRSAFLGLGMAVVLFILLSRRRLTFLAILLVAVPLVFLLPGLQDALQHVLSKTSAQMGAEGGLLAGSGRLDAAIAAVKHAFGPWTFVSGCGRSYYASAGWYAHNSLLSIVLPYGLAGLVWFVLYFVGMARRGRFLARYASSPFARVFGAGVGWVVVTSIFSSLTADNPLNTIWFYGFMWMGAMTAAFTRLQREEAYAAAAEPPEYAEHEEAGAAYGLPY